MPINVDYVVLKNRMKQGGAVSAAAFAMTAVTAYRLGHEKGIILTPTSVMKFSAIVAGVAGVIWACMPKAKESPGKTVEEAKEQIYPAVKIAISRILQNEQELQDSLKPSEATSSFRKSYSYSGVTSNVSSLERSRERLNRRYGRGVSGFDTDFSSREDSPEEDDFVTDEEFEDILREEMEQDPFYEGPGSLFDRL
jgi:hypothetical protein